MPQRILILTITAGQGHNATAKAIEAALTESGNECRVLDTYYYLSKLLGDTVAKGYLLTLNVKHAYRTTYTHLEKRRYNSYKISPTRITNMAFYHKMKKFIDDYAPDIIVCTHIFAGVLIDVIKQFSDLRAKTIGILTDFTLHPYWEEALRFDYIVIPSELLTEKALRKGFDRHQILPFGIPILPKFNLPLSRAEARGRLGIEGDRPIILLMSGSMGFGRIEKTVGALDRMDVDFDIVTVCGNNRSAKAKIDGMKPQKVIMNLGYTDQVDVLMSASDCIVTKPGGLTTSEALAKRLPIIISNPIPGQEDRNTEFLLNHGAAMAVTPTTPLDEILHQFFRYPERLGLMRASTDLIRKPDSTGRLCAFIDGLPGRLSAAEGDDKNDNNTESTVKINDNN